MLNPPTGKLIVDFLSKGPPWSNYAGQFTKQLSSLNTLFYCSLLTPCIKRYMQIYTSKYQSYVRVRVKDRKCVCVGVYVRMFAYSLQYDKTMRIYEYMPEVYVRLQACTCVCVFMFVYNICVICSIFVL